MEDMGLHLLLAVHGAMGEWLRYWRRRAADNNDREAHITRRAHRIRANHIAANHYRELLPSLEGALKNWMDEQTIPNGLADSLKRAIRVANHLSMGEQLEQFLSDDLGMALTDDDRRALSYRNELAHDGAFRSEFTELDYEARNLRSIDLNRLRNLSVEVILRLCGYSGPVADFTTPGRTRSILSDPSPFSTTFRESV
jgi:hypothetical protein